ncbi:MAG TPA: AMP-binding protein [Polyangiales bacterium]|nr:AMP-binding protein [Polyangiales bacterium]
MIQLNRNQHSQLTDLTVGAALRVMAQQQPLVEALVSVHQGLRFSYAEFAYEVERTALALLALGIAKGDRVGIWSQNCAEWAMVQFATGRIGAILVNVNPAYRADEARYALHHSGVRLLFSAQSFKSSDYLQMLAEIRAQLPMLERVVTLGAARANGPDDLLWSELAGWGHAVPVRLLEVREASLRADEPINIQYTSGTTGNPKGATLTHRNILNNARSIAQVLGYTWADRVCIPLPLYHCFGMGVGNLGCVSSGATMVYPAAVFDPLTTLQAVQDERCTSVYGVPTMFIAQLEHPRFAEFDLRSLRTGLMGGAPCPIETMRQVVSKMHAREVCIVYGMTETAPVTFMSRPHDSLERRVSTVGTVMPHIEAKIVDPASGLTLPPGDAGEVCTRGYALMPGYWNDRAATAAAIDAEGWMHTGDLGVLDGDGYLNIVGRIKDMVIRGGENLYPREIEEVLFRHPAIASAQVVGVPDAFMGEELMAWVIVREGMSLAADELRSFCRAQLAHFKVPRYVKFTDAYPLTVTGKVQKFRLRQLGIEELGLHAVQAIQTA